MPDVLVWIKNNTVLLNLSSVAYIHFGDEPDSKVESQPRIVFRTAEGQHEQFMPLEKEEANRIKDFLRSHFQLGLVRR